MKRMRHARRWAFGLMVTALLVLSLALAACGNQASTQGSSNTTNGYSTSQQPTQAPATSSGGQVQGTNDTQIQSTDQQIQDTLKSIDDAQKDATNDTSANDSEQMP